jgi:hypothetical protein
MNNVVKKAIVATFVIDKCPAAASALAHNITISPSTNAPKKTKKYATLGEPERNSINPCIEKPSDLR